MSTTLEKAPTRAGERRPVAPFEDILHPFARLRSDMERLFDDFFAGTMVPFGGRGRLVEPFRAFERALGATTPAVDLVETEQAFELKAELPGLDEKNVEVTLSENVLTIKGEKKEEHEEDRAGVHYAERRFGSFERAFRLPENVDQDTIAASFKNGVLTVTMPKTAAPEKPQKKIEIKAEAE
ncbi:MAG: Hsp20/alpha crystallin family protein [Rhodospirillales bacterium]|jgi:HSP20 family protein|nr:Hsp20/alpha crystallin family protein [Rhodospirillales bacterium]